MVHVRAIAVQNFMSHDDVTVGLPETGVVLVTGPNGAGKSALVIESVAAACFGRTLRGTPPWRDEEGTASVIMQEAVVTRTRAGSKPAKLVWHLPDDSPVRYDTASKAQDALSAIIGSFDTWRRTSVFSSSDASHFSEASDKDRKLLLEQILGLERFDQALKQCREDIRDTQGKIRTFEGQAALYAERLAGIKSRMRDLADVEASEAAVVTEPRVPDEKVARMKKLDADLAARKKQLGESRRVVEREHTQADVDFRTCRAHAEKLDKDACPSCGQSIPNQMRKDLRDDVARYQAASERVWADVQARLKEIDGEVDSINLEREDIRTFLERAARVNRDHDQLDQNREKRADKWALFEHQVEEATLARDKAKESAMLLSHEHDELEVTEKVLGLKGVRAHILGDAMRAITSLANAWLARLFPGTTIFLHEDGDKVALEVRGLEHGYGYHATSGGQRRRIDIAILLALSDLEAASRSVQPGTLFLDEVADSLDLEDGIPSFCTVLEELAQTRAVVLISHNLQLNESLQPALRIRCTRDGVRVS